MPQINLNKIKEFSSEDVSHQMIANNLLRTNEYKSWKCNEWQSISYVIFELSKPTLIHSIEIGNDCSAFVEILVSHSEAIKPRYQVLLSTSSFMTPSESHSLTNCNRVRIFNKEKLSPNSVNEKWDLIKVVCTQPFNKTISYGLSFIRLNSRPEEESEELEANTTALNIGPFKLKTTNEEQESETSKSDFTAGSLFSKRSNNESPDTPRRPFLSTPSAKASITPQSSPKTSSPSVKPKESTSEASKRVSSVISSSNTRKQEKAGPSPPKRQRKQKPFNQLMSKVVFCLSGFVNPKRSELRDKAIAMGAKYKADWDTSCTHLICAFANTPKFNEVKSKSGRIVKQKWIEDCFAQRKLIWWRNYTLGQYNGPDSDSDDEDDEEEEKEEEIDTNKVQYMDTDEEETPPLQSSDQLLINSSNSSQMREIIGFGNDSNENDSNDENDKNDAIYDAETDSESNTETVHNSQEKESVSFGTDKALDIFKDKYFHFYGPFDEKEKETLTQYIIAYKGKIENELTSNVKYVITNSDWNQDFEEACAMNECLVFVKPKWIFKCHQNSKLFPYQPFVVSCSYD